MWVVKLGGSFFDAPELVGWVKTIAQHGAGKVVLVPGGGPFADQVRQAQKQHQFNDQVAHHMALHAMDQFGLFLIGIAESHGLELIPASSLQEIDQALVEQQTPVWLPSKQLSTVKDIKESWDVTSDSLSAWLARKLNSEQLILIKSVRVDSEMAIAELQRNNLVDSAFNDYLENVNFKTICFSFNQHLALRKILITYQNKL